MFFCLGSNLFIIELNALLWLLYAAKKLFALKLKKKHLKFSVAKAANEMLQIAKVLIVI